MKKHYYIISLIIFIAGLSGCTKEQGCTNPEACNFSQSAEEDDGSCYLPGEECDDGNDSTILDQYTNTCQCEGVDLSVGCTDDTACNYSASANSDDESCYFIGDSCDDDNNNTLNDTWTSSCSCTGELPGCTSTSACNYNPQADLADGSCYFIGDSCDDGNSASVNDTWSSSCICEGFVCGSDLYHEGYTYSTVQIGNQCWFAENCRYLPEVMLSSDASTSDPAYYVYGYEGTSVWAAQSTTNYETYGVLYNWTAAMSEDICPSGWHIPSDGEFTQLTSFLGGSSVAGGKMKEAGYDHWLTPNTGATNSSGFTGLPGGYLYPGYFFFEGERGILWSSSETGFPNSWSREIDYDMGDVFPHASNRYLGFSARCLQD
jgi:uncharacterized protein (TIGR02145 family)